MTGPLLETKLRAPRPRRGLVPRPRLRERLGRVAESKLTIVSAPAGFGKTTLLADWLAASPDDGWASAWLSLDPSDDDPGAFWTQAIAALQRVVPDVGRNALAALGSAPQRPIRAILTSLINDLDQVLGDVVLVLDDYHVVDSGEIHEGMEFLLDHLPARMHLVIATRVDPPLSLARLRARGELAELRAADLRFDSDEAASYLSDSMGLDLAPGDVAALEGRTEGWIAALQLAALSMQGRADPGGFIAGFAGDDRYVVDYLVEEVLERQPADVRTFLLDTSILDHLVGPLCDALTGQDGGKAMLEALDRRNLFLVPLDDRRQWYRYHHLFADVLRARLLDTRPARVPELHRRASDWYERTGDRPEAIRHAIAGGHVDRAADLIELGIPAIRQARREATLRRWVDAVPETLFRNRPVLALAYVGSRLVSGDLEGVEARLRDAERWVDVPASDPAATDMIVVDTEAFRHVPGAAAIYRAALAQASGDVGGTVTHAERALRVITEDDHFGRGAASGFLGLAHWTRGDLEVAHGWWTGAAASLGRAGHRSDVLGCSIALADIRLEQGRLRDALRTYQQGLALAMGPAAGPLRGVADMHVGLSALFLERNDIAAAREHLQASDALGEEAALAQNAYRRRVAMARLRETEGELDAALALLDEAEHVYASDYFPNVRPLPAMRARLWIRQGRLDGATAWARGQGLSPEDELSYLRESDHITLARLFLARSEGRRGDASLRAALGLLDRLLVSAERGGRLGNVIEILLLQAIGRVDSGDLAGADAALDRALTLAAPEGYVRIFIDEGPAIMRLLRAAAKRASHSAHVEVLLAASADTRALPAAQPRMPEPLTERELDVLRLLATDLDGPQIARRLFVSPNTMRTHTRNIYAKLGANSRRDAVRRAVELGLLSRAGGG